MESDNIFIKLEKAFEEYNNVIDERKKRLTPEFNLVYLIEPKELQLSRIIVELLNPYGRHEQKDIFLHLFIDILFQKLKKLKRIKEVELILEYPISNGQIDIVIDFNSKFGIAIENKPSADDQMEQIVRYTNYLSGKYDENNFLMIYLSADGSNPSENSLPKREKEKLGDKFKTISYSKLIPWINECSKTLKKDNAKRLSVLLQEFSEYINIRFNKTNTLKNKMIGKVVKENILEAFQINKLWNDNKSDFISLWEKSINKLVNAELPKLLFEELVKRNVINDEWDFIAGDFDISKLHVKGPKIKKKKWGNFEYAILSEKSKTKKGQKIFSPAIISKRTISKNNYLEIYSKETNT